MLDEALADAYKADWEREELKRRVDEARCHEELRRSRDENAQLRPLDECNRSMMGKAPLENRLKD